MQIAFPYHIRASGRTGAAAEAEHIRDLIEHLLFTSPGERVNRPDFGSGLLQMVFAPNSDELAAALQFTVQGALQQWLGDRISVDAVEVTALESTLQVIVRYRTPDGEERTTELSREV